MDKRIYDAFDSVKAEDGLKTSACEYLLQQRRSREKRKFYHTARKWALAACAAFIVIAGAAGYYGVSQTPVAYISIDVNPSVELALNRWDKVISATAYNEDGGIILKSASVEGMMYADAIDAIVECEAMQPYLTESCALTFTVASEDSAKEDEIRNTVNSCSACKIYGARNCRADVADINEAHANGMSFGKYRAYIALSQYDGTVTPQECKNMTMAEIYDCINAHSGSGGQSENHHGGGNGGGEGNGFGNGNRDGSDN